MRRIIHWQIVFGTVLISLSAFFYSIHYLIFKDSHDIFFYLLHDIAFVPIEILMVTLIVDGLLRNREKRTLLNKMNMLIGAFYSEAGAELLSSCAALDPRIGEFRRSLIVDNEWSDTKFAAVRTILLDHQYTVDSGGAGLEKLKDLLVSKRNFFLSLLANPNLLEHESFTEVLWAVFHLTEELAKRKDVRNLPQKDREHIEGDIKRVYKAATQEWLAYMNHLKKSYPYLFSLAVRTNPFNPDAEVAVG